MLVRQAFVQPGENGFWVAEVPSLPGCISQGSTKEGSLRNIKEAVELYIETMQAEHRPVPDDTFDAMIIAV